MRYAALLLAVLLLNGCALAAWENGGTSLQYDGSGIWSDGGWLMHSH